MASIWEKAISNLAGNLNSGRSYLITAVIDRYIAVSKPSLLVPLIDTEWQPIAKYGNLLFPKMGPKPFQIRILTLITYCFSNDVPMKVKVVNCLLI